MSTPAPCSRCGRQAPRVSDHAMPGALGETISERVCVDCWNEWREMEVRVINELRLNFMDPAAQATLEQKMREFLGLVDDGDRTD